MELKLLTISVLTSFQVFSQTPPNQQNSLNASGYVGVGTTNPDSKLQVNGNMSVDSSLTVRDTAVFEKQARMKDKIIVEGDAVIKGKLTAKDNFKVLGTAKMEGNVKMTALPNANANDTSLLFINANGKVTSGGIPTLLDVLAANPQAVEILKNLIYDLPTQGQGELCLVDMNGGTIFLPPYWQTSPQKMFILNSTCKPDVKLGVGIIPEAKFHVRTSEGLTTNPVLIEKSIAGNSAQKLLQLDNNGWLYTHSLSLSETYTSPNTFALLSVKNTNRPASLQIDARGNTLNYQKLLYMQFDGSNNTELIKIEKSNESDPRFLLRGDGSFYIYNGTKKLIQMDAGGVLKTRDIYVDMQSWPDYVFKKEYKLLSLGETEQYIKENGHLPNVPSAEQIETEGLNIAETNKMLMQKVEELTLHLIAQEKMIEEQQLELKGIKSELNKIKTK